MISGIKIGPKTWKDILFKFTPQVCEIWFRVDKVVSYREMFSYVKRKRIKAGLHFWGLLPGSIMPNFAFPEPVIRKLSVELVLKTIDIASGNGFHYVNIHPGSYRLSKIYFDRKCMRPVRGQETTASEGNKVLFENIDILHNHASKRGVLLIVETIPSREPMNWKDLTKGRLKTQDMKNVPVAVVEELAERGIYVCNDFCHTAMDVIADDREYILSQLFLKSKRLASQTKLLHINSMPEPFNGTDSHLGIRIQDFKNKVFPSRDQLKKLLRLFVNREDVWAIPEPFSDHIENTKALTAVIEEIKK